MAVAEGEPCIFFFILIIQVLVASVKLRCLKAQQAEFADRLNQGCCSHGACSASLFECMATDDQVNERSDSGNVELLIHGTQKVGTLFCVLGVRKL